MSRDLKILLGLLVVSLAFPVLIANNSYYMYMFVLCFIWASVAAAWDLTIGYAGLFTFSMIAFFTIGAYTTGILTVHHGFPSWLGLLVGGVVTAVFGFLIGIPCLKLKGAYIALITFALHLILSPLICGPLGRLIGTGGHQGLLGVPPLKFGGYIFGPQALIPWYYTVVVLTFIIFFIIYWLIHSLYGLSFTALRDAEDFAESLGVKKYSNRLLTFVISAFLTGVVGAFYAHFVGNVSRRILDLDTFLTVMVMLNIGGIGRFPGALIGAFVVTILDIFLRPLGVYRLIIFGGLVILTTIFFPKGIMGVLEYFSELYKRAKKKKATAVGGEDL